MMLPAIGVSGGDDPDQGVLGQVAVADVRAMLGADRRPLGALVDPLLDQGEVVEQLVMFLLVVLEV
jgi:hypothetical protein